MYRHRRSQLEKEKCEDFFCDGTMLQGSFQVGYFKKVYLLCFVFHNEAIFIADLIKYFVKIAARCLLRRRTDGRSHSLGTLRLHHPIRIERQSTAKILPRQQIKQLPTLYYFFNRPRPHLAIRHSCSRQYCVITPGNRTYPANVLEKYRTEHNVTTPTVFYYCYSVASKGIIGRCKQL